MEEREVSATFRGFLVVVLPNANANAMEMGGARGPKKCVVVCMKAFFADLSHDSCSNPSPSKTQTYFVVVLLLLVVVCGFWREWVESVVVRYSKQNSSLQFQ